MLNEKFIFGQHFAEAHCISTRVRRNGGLIVVMQPGLNFFIKKKCPQKCRHCI